MSAQGENKVVPKTLLDYELSSQQDAYINYLIPSITSFLLYTLLFASDCAVVFRHYKDENPIWASITIFLMYLPALVSYVLTVSQWELWPEMEGYSLANIIWFVLKTFQHLLFPVWAVWRYAERIFWSIEAVRSKDNDSLAEPINNVTAPRNIELYMFLQAFLHSLPQMLFQLNVVMRREQDMDKQTADAQIMSLVFNLTKLSATITFYHRFKTQKLAGKQYPWFKSYKRYHPSNDPASVSVPSRPDVDEPDEPGPSDSVPLRIDIEEAEPGPSESRRSSDFYLEPNTPPLKELKKVLGTLRETSIVDGPKRKLYKEETEPDFNIRRLLYIKGLPEDDMAGKLVGFCWWFCFLLARILAISAFAYFYPEETIWILVSHFLIVIAFLIYDAKTDEVQRAKALFFVFVGLIYIFCIIEFKIKFKKTKFIYYGFFTLVFTQNFIMCLVWWFENVDDLENDFWFRYIFYLVVMCSIISLSSMILYLNINKPEKVVVGAKELQ